MEEVPQVVEEVLQVEEVPQVEEEAEEGEEDKTTLGRKTIITDKTTTVTLVKAGEVIQDRIEEVRACYNFLNKKNFL